MPNENLGAAKAAKNDEFYTQWADIEREMNAYLEYNPDVYRDKTILLPCDDPEWSNFTKYFALHFTDFGLKKLVSTSYAPNSNHDAAYYVRTLFEAEAPQFDSAKTKANGKLFILEPTDISGDGVINIEDLQWRYLEGDGDFRSAEVTHLRDEADIIITNPPFSLFREFISWLVVGGKQFSVIGNLNAITYKEVFPQIRDNYVWLGTKTSSQQMFLAAPKDYTERVMAAKPEGMWWRRIGGKVLVGVHTAMWFTNIDHGRRHQPLQLMTMEDNIKFSRHKEVRGVGYQKYDNYEAIEVPFTDAIPSDYNGVMGVPISFLDKYDPNQFEVLGCNRGIDQDPDGYFGRSTFLNGGETFKRIFIVRKQLP